MTNELIQAEMEEEARQDYANVLLNAIKYYREGLAEWMHPERDIAELEALWTMPS